jgi:hypothetical protein
MQRDTRHGVGVGPPGVRVANVRGEGLQETARGTLPGGGDQRRHGVERMRVDGARVSVAYDGEPRGHRRRRRMLPGGTPASLWVW